MPVVPIAARSRARWIPCICAAILCVGVSSGQHVGNDDPTDELARQLSIDLPIRLKIELNYYREDEQEPTQRHRYWITPEKVRGDQWNILEGFGENLLKSGITDAHTSELLSPGSTSYTIRQSHPLSLTLNGPSVFSPSAVLSALRRKDAAGATVELISSDDDSRIYRLKPIDEGTITYPHAYTAIRVRDGRITELVQGASAEHPVTTVMYSDYRELDGGKEHPFRIEYLVKPLDTETAPSRILFEVTSVLPLDKNESVPPIKIPSSYHIVDHIEEVTKHADGRVVGPIEYGAASHTAGAATIPWNQILIVIGVAGVLVAAVLYARRSTTRG